ncbi:Ig-like domain-containing surface protein (fragment) [uncultured Eubacteriales bacterium]|uniref:Ig-like domain-containing surface protein n=1 Tax=uncultured Eubacteriales bacterium TaxID=172733 RepID=A0A212IZ18_9FIRM
MKFRQIGTRILSLALSGVMLASTVAMVPASAASSAYQPIQLEAAPTKIMDYFATQTPDGVAWVTNSDALTFLPAAAIGDVTCAVKATDGAIWVGTENGLMRLDLSETDSRDIVQYFSGNRYLYGGDDKVTGLAADEDGGVWVLNSLGSVHIKMPVMTLEDRTYFYEKMITDVNDRRGMISDNNSYSYNPTTGEYTQTSVSTNDNDGLWTAMYAMGEILRYQTLKEENASAAEIAAAKAAATRATKAVLLLDYISGRGNGFPCRSYMLKSETAAQPGSGGLQTTNGFWFEINMLDGEEYPDPIIDELKQDGTPIGIAQVRITKDAMDKKGSQIFPNDTDYNGLGLSQSSIDTFNETRADGNKLGIDIYSNNGNQVYPLMVEGVNIKKSYTAPTTAITDNDARIKFRLTAPVYEEIPTIFNDLFPDSAIKDGKVDMEQIVYKADTSSDEVDGHYALFLTAYRYLCDEPGDSELKDVIAEAALRMTDLILEDDRYYIVDATGKSTQWSRWLARYFNDSTDVMKAQELWLTDNVGVNEDGDDMLSYGYEDGPLNALEVMSALKIAAYIADGEGDTARTATYNLAYDQCFESPYSGGGNPNDPDSYVNGKGYMDMALEYVERRVVRQATDAYDENDNAPVREYTPGNKIFNNALHADWTQYVNYSDEELGWFPVYALVTLEKNNDRLAKIVAAYDQWYEGQEEREENPFYTFLYQLAHPEKTDVDLQSAVRYLYRSPQLRNNQITVRGDRQDVFYIEAGNRDKKAQTNYALPLDEMTIGKDNGNPFTRYTATGENRGTPYTYGSLDCSTVFTLPYWLGRYYGMITETESSYYARKTPEATISTGSSNVSVTVKDGTAPLARMIVDFYEDGAYIGRARTNDSGVATLTHTAAGTITAIVGERLIGDTMYNYTEVQ